jgi:hypothetical protein
MPRGAEAPIGAERVAPNGYRYRKMDYGWELVSRVLMIEKIGRPLREDEYVAFIDGDKTNIVIENLEIRIRGKASLRKRLAQVEARLAEMLALRDELRERIKVRDAL